MLADDRRDVSVVVLHLDERKLLLMRPFRREVLGVEIARDNIGLNLEQPLEATFGGKPRIVGCGVFHIAHMLGNERLVAPRKREGVLLLRPAAKTTRASEEEDGAKPEDRDAAEAAGSADAGETASCAPGSIFTGRGAYPRARRTN